MTDQQIKSLKDRLSALRNAIDVIVSELEVDQPSDPATPKRRNLREERILEFETNYALGRVRKPKALRKSIQIKKHQG